VCGFEYDVKTILAGLGDAASLIYDPDPKGIRSAREAVADYYAGHGATVDPEDAILTTSTSEAYSFLFRLLCDPGDEVLVAQPSYPLFDFLADLDDVRLRPFPLFEDFGWWIDFAELERNIGPRTRAIVLVHPNNPTGHATGRNERMRLEALCAERHLALIVDEVFLDFGIRQPIESFSTGSHPCLKFIVSGLSKIAALPQMKVGWIACFGPEEQNRQALARLEVIADTFLSMNAPAQHALPVWLAGRESIQPQILDRVRANLEVLAISEVATLQVEAGWSVVLRLPQNCGASDLAELLVREAGVAVHPGAFYGLHGKHHVVASLIGPTTDFVRGFEALKRWCESRKLT
jgi:aspartate/methionine/tyrosine aminotransferase